MNVLSCWYKGSILLLLAICCGSFASSRCTEHAAEKSKAPCSECERLALESIRGQLNLSTPAGAQGNSATEGASISGTTEIRPHDVSTSLDSAVSFNPIITEDNRRQLTNLVRQVSDVLPFDLSPHQNPSLEGALAVAALMEISASEDRSVEAERLFSRTLLLLIYS